jgi:hypothetical protein
MKRVLKIDDELPIGETLDLSDDDVSCRSFWCNLLDYAWAERVEEVDFCPAKRDDCITVSIGERTYPMIPLPYEAQEMYLRYAQKIVLGRFWFTLLVQLNRKPFDRDLQDPLAVQIGDRLSKWDVCCSRHSIRFLRHPKMRNRY